MSRPAADVTFREPHQTDVVGVALHMRAADRAECRAAGASDLLHTVEASVAHSSWARAARVDGDLMGIFGVCPLGTVLSPVGVPWALGTDLVGRHPKVFMRWAAAALAEMLKLYPVLLNYVHADNALAVRWLRHAGCDVAPAAPYGPRGALFHRFEKRA